MTFSPEPLAVRFDADNFWVDLEDGRTIGVPLACIQSAADGVGSRLGNRWWLRDARPASIISCAGDGQGLASVSVVAAGVSPPVFAVCGSVGSAGCGMCLDSC